jgi:antitoxin (DNA-binding transcriptional repressor) of toxin-antitoxin stability system
MLISNKEDAMTSLSIQEAQANLPDLVHGLTSGDEVVIVENDRPVARIVAAADWPRRSPRRPGTLRGTVLYMAPDFDAPLGDFTRYNLLLLVAVGILTFATLTAIPAPAFAEEKPAGQSSPAMASSDERDRAIAAIEKLGGRVEFQNDQPDKPVRLIYLLGDRITDKELALIKPLSDLQRLDLHDSITTDEGLRLLGQMRRLEALYLWNTLITDAGLSHLRGLKHLHLLNLSGTKITDKGLEQVGQMTTLDMLRVDDTKVTDAGLGQLKQLERLCMLGLERTAVGDAGLPHIAVFGKLDYLSLDGTRVTDAGIKQLSGLKSLSRLSLEDTAITDAAIAILVKTCPRLQELSIGGTRITDSGLVHLKGLANLRYLGLARTNITDKGLAEIKGLPKLDSLDLRKTKVTEEGVKQLEKQHYFPPSKSSPHLLW